MKKLFYLVFTLSVVGFGWSKEAQAQSNGHYCATDEVQRELIGRNPLLLDSFRMNEELLQNAIAEMRANRSEEPILVIPVVFHVIHNYGPENIPDAQIHSAMNILNRDYRKLNADTADVVAMFDTLIADCKIEFRLATKDFMGNCTNGIERIPSIETYTGGFASKLNQWPRNRYLNIWVVADIPSDSPGETLGYSQLPPAVVGDEMGRRDGIVVRYNSLGIVGQGIASRSRTLTHEVGHYLNLNHTWGGDNEPGLACDGTDAVDDTPPTKGQFGGCDTRDFECNYVEIPTSSNFQFTNVTTSSGLIDPTPVYTPANGDLTISPFVANGLSANPVADGTFGFSNWSIGAPDSAVNYEDLTGTINTGKYYEFTITPTPGRGMTLQSIVFHVKRSLTGPRTFAIRSSLNNYSANLTGTVSNTRLSVQSGGVYFFKEDTTSQFLTGINIPLPANSNPNLSFTKRIDPVTFRIYAWNSEDTDGSFEIDNFTITGRHGQLSNTQNYMNYADCSIMFTEGQKERMRAALMVATAGRNNLWTEQNRINTGTWDVTTVECAPKADFYPANRFACINTPIQFFDNSTNATVTSWYWTFEDGNPATSTEQNPTVSFTSGGNKTVTLTVTGAQGEDVKQIPAVVRIAYPYSETSTTPLSENFDNQQIFWNNWVTINTDNTPSYWHPTNSVGYSNNTSAMLNAYDMAITNISSGGGAVDELISPAFPMQGLSNPSLSFRYAFATQSPNQDGITDRLQMMYSMDCGATWYSLTSGTINPGSSAPISFANGTIQGLQLVSAAHHSTPFVPTTADDWNYVVVNFPNAPASSKIRFKFVFTAGEYPNNLYIDDINFNATVGLDEVHSDFYGVSLFPNPASTSATLVYTTKNTEPINITLTDMSGRVVNSWTPNVVTPGQQTLTIPTEQLAKGVYMVSMRSESSKFTLRLLVQ